MCADIIHEVALSPRLLTTSMLAVYLGMTDKQFAQRMPDFIERGLPQPVMALGLYDKDGTYNNS
ncbi:MAG TPA: hypothetical protein VF194_09140 [Ferrovibrio sp.]|uniref:hypothetical protein n=1 Tax=Ferrovibrio sp. TaxID=1917215 RepID=UPI002ED5991E